MRIFKGLSRDGGQADFSKKPSRLSVGEDTLAVLTGGGGVNILEDARHSTVLYICKYFVLFANKVVSRGDCWEIL